jgi:ankyrin repeat protein
MKLFKNAFFSKPNSIYRYIEEGNINEIRDYLNGTKKLNSDFKVQSILHYAIDNCQNNYLEVIEFLINNGADINSHCSTLLETPLHRLCARIKPQLDIITMILERGTEVNAVNISGKTPIFYCNLNYSVELLKLLVKYGADINKKDKYKNTILHDDYINCFEESFEEFLKVLISLGFDINSKNSSGFTPLDLCENNSIGKILIEYGGNK